MHFFNRFTAISIIAAMLGPTLPLQARTKKGDRLLAEGRAHELKKEWDAALESYQKALSEDPADLVANLLRNSVRHLSLNTTLFAGVYLLAHGLAKLLLVVGLLRGRRWAYPAALWFLAAFVLYQCYRILLTQSLPLTALTAFDIVVMSLIWREYRFRKRARLTSA